MSGCLLYVVFLWVVQGDEFESEVEAPVENSYEEQVTDPTEDITGKMIITPDITSIFAC